MNYFCIIGGKKMNTPGDNQESKKSSERIAVYGRSAIAPSDDSYAGIAAWFLGPKAENQDLMKSLFIKAMDDHANLRMSYYKGDPEYITDCIKSRQVYIDAIANMDASLTDLMNRLHKSVPFFSTSV